ncbi:MAG: DNA polymerase III subunit gamma/tau, partial [Mycobacteriaceae bacterium]|nr:DNA polymerase III subunit gamma/tau [Mycobacteriaceae bacterium]
PKTTPQSAPTPTREPEPSAPGELDAADVRRQWSTVRDRVSERSKSINAMLSDAVVRALEGDTLVLSHPAATLAKRLDEQRNADVIREALKNVLGVNWKVRCEPTPPDSSPPNARHAEEDRAEEDSMLAEADSDSRTDQPRRDPEEVALELLQNELGARRIEP